MTTPGQRSTNPFVHSEVSGPLPGAGEGFDAARASVRVTGQRKSRDDRQRSPDEQAGSRAMRRLRLDVEAIDVLKGLGKEELGEIPDPRGTVAEDHLSERRALSSASARFSHASQWASTASRNSRPASICSRARAACSTER
jgi:hypothetical protein